MKNWYINLFLIIAITIAAFYYAVFRNFPDKQWTHWFYHNTIIGYIYYKSFDENIDFYNMYFLNDFKIDKPVVARFSNWNNGKVYVFSENIAGEYLKDTANFILREDVYECYSFINSDTRRFTVKSWKYHWCSISMPIGTDEENFEATFKFRTKIGGLEIYDFLIKPKGFVCILAQTPIVEWWEDVGTIKGYEKQYQPYVQPYFSYANSDKYYNMVMDKLMTEEYYEQQDKLFGPIEQD